MKQDRKSMDGWGQIFVFLVERTDVAGIDCPLLRFLLRQWTSYLQLRHPPCAMRRQESAAQKMVPKRMTPKSLIIP